MLTFAVRTVEFYRTPSGSCPMEEFLDGLSDQHAQKALWVLRLVERLDRVPEQYLKKLVGTEHIWEIRTQMGGMSYRMLVFFDGPTLLILTNGFAKKRQKTPPQDIAVARRRRDHYLQRKAMS